MLIGAPTEMKTSEAFCSAISSNSRFIAIHPPPPLRRFGVLFAQQFVDTGFRARLRVHLLHDDGCIEAVFSVGRRQVPRNYYRSGRDAAVERLAREAVVDARAHADEYAHGNDGVFLDDHAFDDFRTRADEAVDRKSVV